MKIMVKASLGKLKPRLLGRMKMHVKAQKKSLSSLCLLLIGGIYLERALINQVHGGGVMDVRKKWPEMVHLAQARTDCVVCGYVSL